MYKGYSWGKICGLSSGDFEVWQLEKIDNSKLMEMATEDKRAEIIFADRMFNNVDYDALKQVVRLEQNDFEKLEYIKVKYNETIRLKGDQIEGKKIGPWSVVYRQTFVIWPKLDDDNRLTEIERWTDGLTSVLNPIEVDIGWIVGKSKTISDRFVKKVMGHGSYLGKIIPSLPEQYLLAYINDLQGNNYIMCLSNKYIPDNHAVKILRKIAGRKNVPIGTAYLNKNVIESLPPVTRLKAFETLLIHSYNRISVNIDGINSKNEFSELFFSASFRYNYRVQTVVNRLFKD